MPRDPRSPPADGHDSPFARLIGRSRVIVIVAVVAVLLSAFSLFLLGAYLAGENIYAAWRGVFGGDVEAAELTIRFLEIVTVMLKAVFFYLIGVGLYSLFISPLNVTVAMGVETLNDLETKVISVVIVIMGVHFLEHFIQWVDPMITLQQAASLALVVTALVFFKIFAHREARDTKRHRPEAVEEARREMFEHAHEQHDIADGDAAPRSEPAGRKDQRRVGDPQRRERR
ncbi:MAG TPA: YqhA family protein [Burkholderiales bacterium]|nr:YqhA family protein [Burkholderiales bacterium]